MKTLKLVKLEKTTTLDTLKFAGIEVLEAKSGTGGTDFKGLRLRDKETGTILQIELGPYSDLNIYTELQPKYKKVIRLGGKMDGAGISKDFDKKEEAEIFATEHNLTEIEYLEVQVEETE